MKFIATEICCRDTFKISRLEKKLGKFKIFHNDTNKNNELHFCRHMHFKKKVLKRLNNV